MWGRPGIHAHWAEAVGGVGRGVAVWRGTRTCPGAVLISLFHSQQFDLSFALAVDVSCVLCGCCALWEDPGVARGGSETHLWRH